MLNSDPVEPMQIEALWRYPVKSMQGEACDELEFTQTGVAGDRSFGVLDLASGTIISAKREGRMLQAAASLTVDGLVVTLPAEPGLPRGSVLDEQLAVWLGRPVKLVDALAHGVPTFESQEDYERDDSALDSWQGQSGSFVDESALHLITRANLDSIAQERPDLQWDVRRFRPNVVVTGGSDFVVSSLPGLRLRLGGAVIEVVKGCSRCVMTTRQQPGNLDRQLDVLRHVNRVHDNEVGVRARVLKGGTVRIGDPVTIINVD